MITYNDTGVDELSSATTVLLASGSSSGGSHGRRGALTLATTAAVGRSRVVAVWHDGEEFQMRRGAKNRSMEVNLGPPKCRCIICSQKLLARGPKKPDLLCMQINSSRGRAWGNVHAIDNSAGSGHFTSSNRSTHTEFHRQTICPGSYGGGH